jgi:peptidoglycan lytic transglycosylase
MRGVGRVLPRGISISTWAAALAAALLCAGVALIVAGLVQPPEPGAGLTPLPRAAHLPLQPSQSSNEEKKATREPVHRDPSRLDAARRAPQDEGLDDAPRRAPQDDGSGASDTLPETGRASWYELDSKTASGEQMDGDALTAAHPTLPLGTRVRVANLDNGRAVVVRINDRGPFAKDRIIDVSKAAAKALGMVKDGVANVRVSPVAGAVAANGSAR